MHQGLVVGLPVGDFVLLFCLGTACISRMMCDLILLFGKKLIYSTKHQYIINNLIDRQIIKNTVKM